MSEALNHAGVHMWGSMADDRHFEDIDVLRANEAAVIRAGTSWKNCPDILEPDQELIEWLKAYKNRRNHMHPRIWGVKDPRISFLYNSYKEVFSSDKVLWMACIRDPREAGASHLRNHRVSTLQEGMELVLRRRAILDRLPIDFTFNFNGNLESQSATLSNLIGKPINLRATWKK